jgi:hypothetical protein
VENRAGMMTGRPKHIAFILFAQNMSKEKVKFFQTIADIFKKLLAPACFS